MQKLVELATSHPLVLLTLCLPPEKGMAVVSPMNVFVLLQLGGYGTFGILDEPSFSDRVRGAWMKQPTSQQRKIGQPCRVASCISVTWLRWGRSQ
jgi:hypothetical protein